MNAASVKIDAVATAAERRMREWKEKGYDADWEDEKNERAVVRIMKNEKLSRTEYVETVYSLNPFAWEDYNKCIEKGLSLGVLVPEEELFPRIIEFVLKNIIRSAKNPRSQSVQILTYDKNGDIKDYWPRHRRAGSR